MNNNSLTNVFGFIFASDLLKNAIERLISGGLNIDSASDLIAAFAAAAWAWYTNKPA